MNDLTQTENPSLDRDAEREIKAPRIRVLGIIAIIVSVTFAVFAAITLVHILDTNSHLMESNNIYDSCKDASKDLQNSSDYLTSQSRMYVTTGDQRYLENYLAEYNDTTRRKDAVNTLESIPDSPSAAEDLQEALNMSNKLAETEFYALTLAASAYDESGMLSAAVGGELTEEDKALSSPDKISKARELLLNRDYDVLKSDISHNIESSVINIVNGFDQQRKLHERHLNLLLSAMAGITVALLITVLAGVIILYRVVLRPLNSYEQSIRNSESLSPAGSYEMRYFAHAYNLIFERNRQRTETLRQAAEHDSLTGLHNRGAYDTFIVDHLENCALLIIDVDNFKSFNDSYGHNMGDAVLKKVADGIVNSFRTTDYAVRIGGDEFAVVMQDVTPGMEDMIVSKLHVLKSLLSDRSDGMPEITLSIGIAFSFPNDRVASLNRHADRALYKAKEAGRDTYEFYVPIPGEKDIVEE